MQILRRRVTIAIEIAVVHRTRKENASSRISWSWRASRTNTANHDLASSILLDSLQSLSAWTQQATNVIELKKDLSFAQLTHMASTALWNVNFLAVQTWLSKRLRQDQSNAGRIVKQALTNIDDF